MRYIKVFLLVLILFFVMLFFMDNQAALTTKFPLTLDLRFIPAWKTSVDIPCYFLMLGAFVIGALCTLTMLLWDRLSLGTRAGLAKMRVGSLERDLSRAAKNSEKTEHELRHLQEQLASKNTEVESLKNTLKDTEARALAAEQQVLTAAAAVTKQA